MTPADILLVVLAVAFAWSMGAHYTGACMGMPYAAGALDLRRALWVVAILSLIGATFASHSVQRTVAFSLIESQGVTTATAIVVVIAAFLLTTVFTYLKVPTSTIQILVFSVTGAATAAGVTVHWDAIGRLAVVWVLAPLAAAAFGYALSRAFAHSETLGGNTEPTRNALPAPNAPGSAVVAFLIIVGVAVSFTMGANDVSNASGVLLMTGHIGIWVAGILGGIGLAVGAVTWGRPLLRTVAFDIAKVDPGVAVAAQAVQAAVVLTAVFFGYFTSLNQALVGALAGAGSARGRHTVNWRGIRGILLGWVVGPAAGFIVAFALQRVASIFA